jgi:hypothetical protein
MLTSTAAPAPAVESPPCGRRRSRRALRYFISATTDALVGVSGTLIELLMIPRVPGLPHGPWMYFVCISETPLLRPSV